MLDLSNIEIAVKGILQTFFYWMFPGCYALLMVCLAIFVGNIYGWLVMALMLSPLVAVWGRTVSKRMTRQFNIKYGVSHYLTDEEFNEAIDFIVRNKNKD